MNIDETPELVEVKKKDTNNDPNAARTRKTRVGKKHKELIDHLVAKGHAEWDEAKGKLNTHTYALLEAHEELDLKGKYDTLATGKELPGDRNCYCKPAESGAWAVYRHGQAGTVVAETPNWFQSKGGYTTCFFNRPKKKMEDPIHVLVNLARDNYTFFRFQDEAFVEVMRHGHRENLLVGEDKFRRMLRLLFVEKTKNIAQAEWLKNALDQLKAYALEEGDEYPVYNRLARHGDKVFLDLIDKDRTIIEIDAEGWRICEDPPVRFRRGESMLALPLPEKGGTKEDLQKFLNIEKEDLILLLGVLAGYLNPDGPFPILLLIGGDGRGKTILAQLILLLLDPTKVIGCSPPTKIEDLMISAKSRRILFFDNLSEMKKWLSDALCRMSTGAAQERRTLYADQDLTTFLCKCPVILTSIRDIIESPDLGSRTIKFDMPRVEKRLTEKLLMKSFNAARPKIVGWLLDGLVSALKNQDTTVIEDLPRLADFCVFAQAAEEGLGLEAGSVLAAYRENRTDTVNEFLASPLAQGILALEADFKGTLKQLAQDLKQPCDHASLKVMAGDLRDLVTSLETQGIRINFRRSHGKKRIEILKETPKK